MFLSRALAAPPATRCARAPRTLPRPSCRGTHTPPVRRGADDFSSSTSPAPPPRAAPAASEMECCGSGCGDACSSVAALAAHADDAGEQVELPPHPDDVNVHNPTRIDGGELHQWSTSAMV